MSLGPPSKSSSWPPRWIEQASWLANDGGDRQEFLQRRRGASRHASREGGVLQLHPRVWVRPARGDRFAGGVLGYRAPALELARARTADHFVWPGHFDDGHSAVDRLHGVRE